MKALFFIISLCTTLCATAQTPHDTGLVLTDTQKTFANIQTHTLSIQLKEKDTVISYTVDTNAYTHTYEGVVDEEPFIEEYYMVLLFLGILALFALYQFLKKKDQKEEVEAEEIYVSKHFGEINKTQPKEFYETKADLYERRVDLIINLTSEKKINQENIERIEDFIDHLVINTNKIKKVIHEDFTKNGEVKNYIDTYLKNQVSNSFTDKTGPTGLIFTKEEQVLSLVYLLRVSFYPEKHDKVFAVLDYKIDDGTSNYLLVVIIAKDDRISITIEN